MRIEISNVYHYTSLETFFKLLDGIQDDNFIMYASRISDLNDCPERILRQSRSRTDGIRNR